MLELHDGLMWLGNARDARTAERLFELGILAVVDVAYEEPISKLPRSFVYCRFPLNDGGGNNPAILSQAVQTTVDLLDLGIPTLIACSAGMSRSPAIAAHALGVYLKEEPDEVLTRIAEVRPLGVNGELWSAVGAILSEIRRRQ